MSSKIEWTQETWNPVIGCSKISAGCENCYAIRMAWRLSHNPKMIPRYQNSTLKTKGGAINWTGQINLIHDLLDKPLKIKKPTTFFVNSMSDLFHPEVPFSFIWSVWEIMDVARVFNHTFQILTKRPERALEFFNWAKKSKGFTAAFDNVWIGVSVENQTTADERIPLLLNIPAAVHFLSMEPLLGMVDLTQLTIVTDLFPGGAKLNCLAWDDERNYYNRVEHPIDWVIVGGESGPNARPMHPDWVRSIRDQCQSADVPFFFKQWGEWVEVDFPSTKVKTRGLCHWINYDKSPRTGIINNNHYKYPKVVNMGEVGKKVAGNMLDGKQHLEFPKSLQSTITD
jgi:protein gp37